MTGRPPANLLVLLSGSGRTLANLAHHIDAGTLNARIARVIASREGLGVERAQGMGLSTSIIPGDLWPHQLLALIDETSADFVVLAGYLRKLPVPQSLEGRIVNIHPALLPGDGTPGPFGGKGMHGIHVHRAVLAAGQRESGCTVHLVTDAYDAGPVILTRRCPVLENDTPESLAARVFDQELLAYPEALQRMIEAARMPSGE